jgi:hypothetical protein
MHALELTVDLDHLHRGGGVARGVDLARDPQLAELRALPGFPGGD